MDPLANGKIQGLFKAFNRFSSTFQDKFNFQGLLKTVLYIQVLFKPVGTLNSHPLNKLGRGPFDDATYKISRLYIGCVVLEKIFKVPFE